MIVARMTTVVQGHTPNGDYLAAQVHLELRDDNILRYHDGEEWQPINVVVRRTPVACFVPALALDDQMVAAREERAAYDELERRRAVTDETRRLERLDLGDDPDGDIEGYDGA